MSLTGIVTAASFLYPIIRALMTRRAGGAALGLAAKKAAAFTAGAARTAHAGRSAARLAKAAQWATAAQSGALLPAVKRGAGYGFMGYLGGSMLEGAVRGQGQQAPLTEGPITMPETMPMLPRNQAAQRALQKMQLMRAMQEGMGG